MPRFILEDKAYEVLRKYVSSRRVDNEEDYSILQDFSGMGMILWGYTTIEEEGDKIDVSVAKLSPLARRIVQREKIWRNPVSRFLYNIVASI